MEFSGLGFELAQLHSSLESTDNMQNRLVQSKLWDRVLRRQQILAKQLELTDVVLSQLTCYQGGGGDTLLQAPAMSFAHEVFDEVSVKNDVASHDEHVVFMSSMMWKGPAEERSNEMPIADVVWDETMQDMVDQHGLLQQLAQGGEYFDADEWKPTAQLFINGGVSEMSSVDVVWDEELQDGFESCDGLLQLGTSSGVYLIEGSKVMWDDELLENDESQDNLFKLVTDGECLGMVDSNSIVELNFKTLTVTKEDGANMLEGSMAPNFCSQGGKWMKLQPYREQEESFNGTIADKQVGGCLYGIIRWQPSYFLLSPALNFEGKFLYPIAQMGIWSFGP